MFPIRTTLPIEGKLRYLPRFSVAFPHVRHKGADDGDVSPSSLAPIAFLNNPLRMTSFDLVNTVMGTGVLELSAGFSIMSISFKAFPQISSTNEGAC